MIIEIEYYKGDIKLSGAKCSRVVLEKRFAEIERIYNKTEDDFAELFCRLYGFERIITDQFPELVYDHDIRRVYIPKV